MRPKLVHTAPPQNVRAAYATVLTIADIRRVAAVIGDGQLRKLHLVREVPGDVTFRIEWWPWMLLAPKARLRSKWRLQMHVREYGPLGVQIHFTEETFWPWSKR